MQKQPAQKSYFFDKGYKDVGNILKKTWTTAFRPVTNEFSRVVQLFADNVVAAIFTVVVDLVVFSIVTAAILLGVLIFSAVFIAGIAAAGVVVYVFYSLLFLADFVFCLIQHISSHCSVCQNKFRLPYYRCPNPACSNIHTALRPSVYGILKRKCNCGRKLPTTFFNGRQKLEAICPHCNKRVDGGGEHTEIMIPIVGGSNSGKTCFVNMAIKQIEACASQNNLVFEYNPTLDDNMGDIRTTMGRGMLPPKTREERMTYYRFYLTPKGKKVKTLVSLCDVAGEAFDNKDKIGEQIGYKNANAFVMVVDPLSIPAFYMDQQKKMNVNNYARSTKALDTVLNNLIVTLESLKCIDAKTMIKTDVVVVFTKCDIPDLVKRMGPQAVQQYMFDNNLPSKFVAQNKLCEQFLIEYGEANFLNSLRSKFRSIQFFPTSALGHVQNGMKYAPQGVEDPILWIIDKISAGINLKNKWGKKI